MPLLVIDGDSFAHRAYHGIPKTLRRAGGKGAGAILGFANYMLRFYESEKPRAVVVGWDTLSAPTWRVKEFSTYQSGREFDEELVEQLEVLPDFVGACGFTVGKAAGYEADDFLAAAVKLGEKRRGTVVVASGDRDAFQLASRQTTILQPVKAGEIARIGPKEVRERYGVDPRQVPDFIALRGDPSDKIPRRQRRRSADRGEPSEALSRSGGNAGRRPVPRAGRQASPLPPPRHHGRQCALATHFGQAAHLGQGRKACAPVGAQCAGRAAGAACLRASAVSPRRPAGSLRHTRRARADPHSGAPIRRFRGLASAFPGPPRRCRWPE